MVNPDTVDDITEIPKYPVVRTFDFSYYFTSCCTLLLLLNYFCITNVFSSCNFMINGDITSL